MTSTFRPERRSVHRLGPVLWIATLLAALGLPAHSDAPAKAASKRSAPPPTTVGSLLIDRYNSLEWTPDTNHFLSPGPVRLTFTDPITDEQTVLTAEDAEGSPTETIVVHGRLLMVRPEGWLTGRSLTYLPSAQTGSVQDAEADVGGRIVKGSRIEMLGPQSLRATNAILTTCTGQHPDYHIATREISVSQNGSVKARNVSFWLGRTRIITLPYLSKSFSQTVSTPIPLPTYTSSGGLQIGLGHTSIYDPGTLLTYSFVLATRKPLQGTAIYERDLGHVSPTEQPPPSRQDALFWAQRSPLTAHPALLREAEVPPVGPQRTTAYVLAAANVFTYNPHRTDLQVTRRPEIGVVFHNMLGRRPPSGAADGTEVPMLSRTEWLLDADASAANIHERPTEREATRISLHSEAVSPLSALGGPLYARWGGAGWANSYGDGEAYGLLAPEGELDYLLRPNTLFGAGYCYRLAIGTTPFQFDARAVRNEMRLWYRCVAAHWGYSVSFSGDLDRQSIYDTSLSIRRRFDCMEVGISYRTHAQMIGLIFNLLPGKPSPPPHILGNP